MSYHTNSNCTVDQESNKFRMAQPSSKLKPRYTDSIGCREIKIRMSWNWIPMGTGVCNSKDENFTNVQKGTNKLDMIMF